MVLDINNNVVIKVRKVLRKKVRVHYGLHGQKTQYWVDLRKGRSVGLGVTETEIDSNLAALLSN